MARQQFRTSEDNRRRNIKRKYGLEVSDVLAMLSYQGQACAICSAPIKFGGEKNEPDLAQIDHDHETGKVRGLLCRLCNVGLGAYRDQPLLLREAARYLEASNG